MSEEEKDILFDIDMQLYNEFNDTIAPMYDHLGEIYTLRDIEEVEKAEKEKEIKLLRGAIKELQKENEKLKKNEIIAENRIAELSIRHGNDRDKIRHLQKENQELKEELDYYKQKENQEFDERDYYEE